MKTTSQFIHESKSIHGNSYEYLDEYSGALRKISILCPIHGIFKQRASSHLMGSGCPACKSNNKFTTQEFINKSNNIHNNIYEYPEKYINARTKIKIICKKHGMFEQTPNNHLRGSGCPKCNIYGKYSKKSIKWLNIIAKHENIFIQHAENIGEFHIPHTTLHADGYCKQLNTIYEFYGDRFHGNLQLFPPNYKCHPFTNETTKYLHDKTLERERNIKKLGYNVISIWENDYNVRYINTC